MTPNLPHRFTHRSDGMALVVSLAVLVLLTILVVAFLSRTSVERTSASAYFDNNQTSLLVDQAVNIVRAQIDYASTTPDSIWASQPGMVRTFDQSGGLLAAFKLYSDSAMVTNTVDAQEMIDSLTDWETSPSHFTDLNEPVEIDGKRHFPIVDALALDVDGGGAPLVEGFEVVGAPGVTARQPIPMPVRWLYVLEDGQAVAPTNGSGRTATIPGADAKNPVIGRIAFWSDDETSKLNINTAAHGSFWDLPRVSAKMERDQMARFQPALREFQRYPGHPATTSLKPVLGYLFPDETDFQDFIFDLAPRIEKGGSLGGTVTATGPVALDDDRLYSSVSEALFAVGPNGERTARAGMSPDDVDRAKFFLTSRSNSPEINLFNLPRMAIWPINAGGDQPGDKQPSTLDEVIAFCATINNQKYYLQRSDPLSSTADLALDEQADGRGRNLQLYSYLTNLLARPFPGFGTKTFAQKYPDETPHLVTEILDYIRSSNLYSTALGADAFTGPGLVRDIGSQAGQVVPLRIGDAKGFGRLPTLSKAMLQLYVSGLRSASGTFLPSADKAQPYYATLSDGDNKVLADFLETTGVGNPVNLLTSGIIYFDTFDPNYGYTFPRYNFSVACRFSGSWSVNGKPLGFQNSEFEITRDHASVFDAKLNRFASISFGRVLGGVLGPLWMMQNFTSVRGNPANTYIPSLVYPLGSDRVEIHLPLILVQDPDVAAPPPKPRLPPSENIADVVTFSGGTVSVDLKVDDEVVQTYEFDFPPFTKPAPVYALSDHLQEGPRPGETSADMVIRQFASSSNFKNRWLTWPSSHLKGIPGSNIPLPQNQGKSNDPYYPDSGLIQSYDTIVSLEPSYGDKRLIAARRELKSGTTPGPDVDFIPNELYNTTSERTAADLLTDAYGGERVLRAQANSRTPGRILDIPYGMAAMPDVPTRFDNGVVTAGGFPADFDNGTFHAIDDSYINRADEGSSHDISGSNTGFAWFADQTNLRDDLDGYGLYDVETFFSPNKQMPSAGVFGSLPTGVAANLPWQTLLFRPDSGGHPGAESPPDYLLLDLFWMPVVEPYAISEPFSSNGKVNLNYQIVPFGYIKRSTALRGVFETQEIVTIKNTEAVGTRRGSIDFDSGIQSGVRYQNDEYKSLVSSSFSDLDYRRKLNLSPVNGTFKSFEDVFADNRIFLSETQICSIPLVPEDATWSADFESDYWDSRRLTGDNSREMPYTQLLPRLTTRSNTFTVHYRVQLLKIPPAEQGTWDEDRHKITAEDRGSRTIERYIDPADTRIPDYAADPAATPSLSAFYRWRMLHNQKFAP